LNGPSPEAVAAYPDGYDGWAPDGIIIPKLREGFDAGRASVAPRVVTTVEELDALPVLTIVKSEYRSDDEDAHDGGVWEKASPLYAKEWWSAGHRRPISSSKNICLPATVLFTPDEGNTP
jgi:hypothetical protein